jgi:hypothetical protein
MTEIEFAKFQKVSNGILWKFSAKIGKSAIEEIIIPEICEIIEGSLKSIGK